MPRIESIVIHQGPQGAKGDPSLTVGPNTLALGSGQYPKGDGTNVVAGDFAADVAATAAVSQVTSRVFDVRSYGGVAGSGKTTTQRQANRTAIHQARDAAVAAGGGTVLLPGGMYEYAGGMLDFSGLGQTTVALCGEGGLNAGTILQCFESGLTYACSFQGTSYSRIEHLTIDANLNAKYGLFCARDAVTKAPAGKHLFLNLRVINGTIASYLNWGSEESTHIHCQFQLSPIGALITGFPLSADPSVVGSTPCTSYSYTAPDDWDDSTNHHFYDCAFGSAQLTTRCGLMIQGSQVKIFGGGVQTVAGAEAAVILDDTKQMASFHDLDFDSGLPLIGYKIGWFCPNDATHTNRLIIKGGNLSISNSATALIDAYNLRSSEIGPLTTANTGAATTIRLRDANCVNNLFVLPMIDSATPVTFDTASAGANNLLIARGRLSFLPGPTGGNTVDLYFASLANRLRLDGGLYVVPPSNATAGVTMNVAGESAARFTIDGNGIINMGPGSAATDTQLRRVTANVAGTGATHGFRCGAFTTAGRPSASSMGAGTQIFDTTLNKPIWSDGTAWRDAAGTVV